PFDGMETLRNEIVQVFNRVSPQFTPVFRTGFLPGRGAREYPLINLYDDQNTVYVEALAPGADPAWFNISVTGETLTVCGEISMKSRKAWYCSPICRASDQATSTCASKTIF